ncbi:MAG TPA: ubiquinol-cytochrome C chaperone family protein, partial [Novosphingobium sp.]|nr:ubiquinol-cytochrome C chaperone family protein [Novosphingobium sp.]
FVTDMDGQLRESGVGDLVVGKHIGKLMGALGGRLDAYRAALADADLAGLEQAVQRNVTLIEGAGPQGAAAEMRRLAGQLGALSNADLLGARIAR